MRSSGALIVVALFGMVPVLFADDAPKEEKKPEAKDAAKSEKPAEKPTDKATQTKDDAKKAEAKPAAPADAKKADDEALIKILKGADAAASAAKKAVDEAAREVKKAADGAVGAVGTAKTENKTEKTDKTEKSDTAEKKDEKKPDAAVEVNLDDAPAAAAGTAKPTAEKKDKPEGATEKKPAAVAKKKDPEPPMFRLRDGTRLAGTPELKVLNVKTAYGNLVVPIAEVVKVRFAASEDVQLAAKVQASIQALGSEEFDRREEAMAALRELGVPALDALKKAVESEDEEVKSRAEKLVAEIEETLDEAEGEDAAMNQVQGGEDEIVTMKFTVRGRVEEEAFQLGTRYGSLKLSRNDIVSVLFQDTPTTKVAFQVPGATFAAANKWVDTKLALSQGERLRITATGQISLENYGQTTGPEGTTNISGNQLENHPTGSLVGKIGEKGKPFLIGADYEGTANAAGTLQLGVSLQNGNVNGQFQVEVEREGES